MSRISKIRQDHNDGLDKYCQQNNISYGSLQRLLEAEKTKKLLRRNALIQQNIDKEIDNALENENK